MKHKEYEKNRFFCILKVIEDFGTDPNPNPDERYGTEDPDQYLNVTDPEHWLLTHLYIYFFFYRPHSLSTPSYLDLLDRSPSSLSSTYSSLCGSGKGGNTVFSNIYEEYRS